MVRKGVKTSFLLASVAMAGLNAPAAFAQPQTGAESRDAEEIVVTASRREQTLQDTAMAVNALTAETLDNANLSNTVELQSAVPNLQYSSGGVGTAFVYLRGVGNSVYGSYSDNSVATYIDGVYVPRSTVANQELFDLERVEVLRGPQATLYGRNATGGAILLNTAAPTDEFEGSAEASFGNYGDQRYRAVLSGPIAGGVNGRVALVRHASDGWNTNLVDGSDVGGQDFWGVRGSLSADFSDNIDILLTANYTNEEGGVGTQKAIDPTSPQFLPLMFGGYGAPFSPDPRASYSNIDQRTPVEAYGATLRLTWDLGFADLISTTARQTYNAGPQWADLDDSSAAALEYRGSTEDTDFTYQDFLLRSQPSDGRWDWLLGLTYVREDIDAYGAVLVPAGPPPFAVVGESVTESTVEGYAIYGQLDFHLTEDLTLVGGLRYSHESRDGVSEDVTFGMGPVANADEWEDVSPRLSLEWRPDQNVLLYASATSGFKSGSFDPQDPTNSVDPETIWSYELGARTDLADWLTLNATLFHYDISDKQVFSGYTNGFRVVTVLQNAAEAEVDGLELEAIVRPVDNVRVGLNASLLAARYADGTILADTANAVLFPVPSVTSYDVGGNHMEQAPDFSGSVFVDWTVPLGSAGELDLYADYFYQSERYFSAFEDPTLRADAYELVNARITYRPPSDNWHIAAYVRNAGDALVEGNMSRVKPFGTLVSYTPPQLYGVEIGVNF